MCCTTNNGTGKSCGIAGSTCARAFGPPVEHPMATTSIRLSTLLCRADGGHGDELAARLASQPVLLAAQRLDLRAARRRVCGRAPHCSRPASIGLGHIVARAQGQRVDGGLGSALRQAC